MWNYLIIFREKLKTIELRKSIPVLLSDIQSIEDATRKRISSLNASLREREQKITENQAAFESLDEKLKSLRSVVGEKTYRLESNYDELRQNYSSQIKLRSKN